MITIRYRFFLNVPLYCKKTKLEYFASLQAIFRFVAEEGLLICSSNFYSITVKYSSVLLIMVDVGFFQQEVADHLTYLE